MRKLTSGKVRLLQAKEEAKKQLLALNSEPKDVDLYITFCEWYAMTRTQKKEYGATTMLEFAAKHDIADRTLRRWKKKPEFFHLVKDYRLEFLQDRGGDVWEGLILGAMKGYADNVELYLAYTENWSMKQVIELRKLVQFAPGDLREHIEKLSPEKQKEHYASIAKLFADIKQQELEAGSDRTAGRVIDAQTEDSVGGAGDTNAQNIPATPQISEANPGAHTPSP